MSPATLIILLWRLGIVDSITLTQFFVNCGLQYSALALTETAAFARTSEIIGPAVLLAPMKGLCTGYMYIQSARCGMEKRKRMVNLGVFMIVSFRAALTDPATNAATGATIASFIAHMRDINNAGNCLFIDFARISKLPQNEVVIADFVIIGGSFLIILIPYVLRYGSRIAKTYLNFCKRSFRYGKTFDKSKIVLRFKYLKTIFVKLSPSILLRNKL